MKEELKEEIEEDKLCRFCNELNKGSHHCSGRKAYLFGKTEALKEFVQMFEDWTNDNENANNYITGNDMEELEDKLEELEDKLKEKKE